MKIPNNDQSVVLPEKITKYLMNCNHETGKHKAQFFSSFGFTVEDSGTFRNALIQHSIDRDIEFINDTGFGVKNKLVCKIQTPDERNPCIVTVWIVESGTIAPKLITAYPN